MTAVQQDLALPEPRIPAEVTGMLDILKTSADWRSARSLAVILQTDDRTVRRCAEIAGDEVISGKRGYKHIDAATVEEIRHFIAWMHSQAHCMTRRAIRTARRAHARLGSA